MANEMSSSQPSDSMDCKMETDMDDSTQKVDQNVDGGQGTSQIPQASTGITIDDLQSAFDIQNQQLKAVLDTELDKRFPAQQVNSPEISYSLSSRIPGSGSHHIHEATNVKELLQERADLTRECQKLQEMNRNARQRIASLEAQIDKTANLAAQVNAVNEKNAHLTQRVAALRQMLVPAPENQVIDSDMVRKFCRIRSSIVTLVRQTWKAAIKPGVKSRELSREQLKILHGDLTYDRLRSVVFSLIHKNIFNARPFFLENKHKEIEKYMQKVESFLVVTTPEDNDSNVIAWRNATLKATESLRDAEGSLAQHTCRTVWYTLDPVQTVDPQVKDRAMRRLQTICDEAVELIRMIRQSKDYIFIANGENTVGTPISEHDGAVEEVATVKAGTFQRRGVIAYVICGALVRKPQDELREQIVLEKAEVAVYR